MNDLQKPYMFISYSHRDDITKYIDFFSQENYNIVYDDSLSYGEEWDFKIRRYLSNPLCKCIVVLLSRSSIASKAVLRELDYIAQFKKNYFAICLDNISVSELYNSIVDEQEKIVAGCIIEQFPAQKLYLKANELMQKKNKLFETFSSWGFEKSAVEIGENIILSNYTTDLPNEHTRLKNQQAGYFDFDKKHLTPTLNSFNRDNLVVLDIGCSTGIVAYSRFNDEEKVSKVIGVDYNKNDVAFANNAGYGEKFVFYHLDIESTDAFENLHKILKENGCENVDFVFSALTLHHLSQPKLALLKLFEILAPDGKIFLRGSDDGGKLCYPNSELLRNLLDKYAKLFNKVNDRQNGRKLYKLLYDTGYNDITLHYSIADTCEKTRIEKQNFFNVGFGFRRSRLKQLLEDNQNNEELKKEINELLLAIDKIELMFAQRDFWYCNTSYIAIAQVD